MRVDGGFGSLMGSFEKAGLFRLGATLVGTIAFRLYEGELGIRYSFDEAAQTNDIDIASFERLSVALEDTVSEPVQKVLAEFSFDPVPSLDRDAVWRWRQTRSDTLVEFLTPSFEEDEGLKKLPSLGVHAQSLHFLNYLIAEPIKAAVPYRSGVLVQIPRPERFAIHKLIVADRRRDGADSLKAHKDRRQASFLIEALAEDRPRICAKPMRTRSIAAPAGASGWRRRSSACRRRRRGWRTSDPSDRRKPPAFRKVAVIVRRHPVARRAGIALLRRRDREPEYGGLAGCRSPAWTAAAPIAESRV